MGCGSFLDDRSLMFQGFIQPCRRSNFVAAACTGAGALDGRLKVLEEACDVAGNVNRAWDFRSSGDANLKKEREQLREALDLLEKQHVRSDTLTYAALIRRCGKARALSEGKRVHAHIVRYKQTQEPFLANLLVDMYARCGKVAEAHQVFDCMQQRNVHSWTIAIAAYAQNGHGKEALWLFRRMYQDGQKPDKVTFSVTLAACSNMGALAEGKAIHAYAALSGLLSNVIVGTAVLSMYGKCGKLADAREVFDELKWRNSVTWNAMMTNYKQNGQDRAALHLFQQMCRSENVKPDNFSYSIAIEACSNLEDLAEGKAIHARIVGTEVERDVIVATALLNMYSKCGSLLEARGVFDRMQHRDAICWNAMIAAYAHHGQGKQALELYKRMEASGISPKQGTFVSVIDVCAELSALEQGKSMHARIVSTEFESNLLVANALIHMYGKCGSMNNARSVFEKMRRTDEISWNTIIASYAYHGHSSDAQLLYQEMDLEGVKATSITFVSILSACNHGGLFEDGLDYFLSMRGDHDIEPSVAHYGCIIDLLGRMGRLAEAEDLITSLPFQANDVQWMSLLGACRTHGDVKRGARAADHVLELIPKISGPYVLLSNIYAAAGRWKDVEKIRKLMVERGVKKEPGMSSIEVGSTVHEFISGDTSHPQLEQIYDELQRLSIEMKSIGYVPDTKAVLHRVEEEDKEHMLGYHSEKLAIAFGSIATQPGTTLRIVKNLRVCSDCHAATKFISKITKREIIVRDANRFHHFDENGTCSCKDYWAVDSTSRPSSKTLSVALKSQILVKKGFCWALRVLKALVQLPNSAAASGGCICSCTISDELLDT